MSGFTASSYRANVIAEEIVSKPAMKNSTACAIKSLSDQAKKTQIYYASFITSIFKDTSGYYKSYYVPRVTFFLPTDDSSTVAKPASSSTEPSFVN